MSSAVRNNPVFEGNVGPSTSPDYDQVDFAGAAQTGPPASASMCTNGNKYEVRAHGQQVPQQGQLYAMAAEGSTAPLAIKLVAAHSGAITKQQSATEVVYDEASVLSIHSGGFWALSQTAYINALLLNTAAMS